MNVLGTNQKHIKKVKDFNMWYPNKPKDIPYEIRH
jgi:hypothetical protein